MCRRKRKAALRGQRGDFIGTDEENQGEKNREECLFFYLKKVELQALRIDQCWLTEFQTLF